MIHKHLSILGIRGIPAAHGGFETFAEQLALYLVERDWQVTVYCQEQGRGAIYETEWQGVRRIHIPVSGEGACSTILFDWTSTRHAAKHASQVLTLGYNTAVFGLLYRFARISNVINMDGIEWQREKWGPLERAWLYLNEWAGAKLGNRLVADHPQISLHLQQKVSAEKITMIPYGADEVTEADTSLLASYDLTPGGYAVVIARPEPENSILPIVRAFSQRQRGCRLVVLGKYSDDIPYHCEVREAAGPEVDFVGAIYDAHIVKALRFHSRLYLHGHTVGGTNPSLVEAMGAGNPILAHDNHYNRWVAGEGQSFFTDEEDCELKLTTLLDDEATLQQMGESVRQRHRQKFTWSQVLQQYEQLLLDVS